MLHVAWYLLVSATLGKGDSTSLVGRSELSQDACKSALAVSVLFYLYLHGFLLVVSDYDLTLTACNCVPNPILPQLASSSAAQYLVAHLKSRTLHALLYCVKSLRGGKNNIYIFYVLNVDKTHSPQMCHFRYRCAS